jgi:DNA-binding transcriptional MerR regulator
MQKDIEYRSIGETARLAGVSVRTLRLYDQLGLLCPKARTAAGYRLYGKDDLLRLQQVLFFKELDVPLNAIRAALDTPGFDFAASLKRHREILQRRSDRVALLMATVDRTICALEGEKTMLKVEELYEGFPKETAERYESEAKAAWGHTDAYAQSRKRVGAMTKDQWNAVKARGERLTLDFAEAFRTGEAPGGKRAQVLCGLWKEHLRAFYDPTPEMLIGLGAMYADHPDFRSFYEKIAPGLADWLKKALAAYGKGVAVN